MSDVTNKLTSGVEPKPIVVTLTINDEVRKILDEFLSELQNHFDDLRREMDAMRMARGSDEGERA